MVVQLSPSSGGEQGIALVSAYARRMDKGAVPRIYNVLSAFPPQLNVILHGDLNVRYTQDEAIYPIWRVTASLRRWRRSSGCNQPGSLL